MWHSIDNSEVLCVAGDILVLAGFNPNDAKGVKFDSYDDLAFRENRQNYLLIFGWKGQTLAFVRKHTGHADALLWRWTSDVQVPAIQFVNGGYIVQNVVAYQPIAWHFAGIAPMAESKPKKRALLGNPEYSAPLPLP